MAKRARAKWTLDAVIALLNEHRQRATYGAIAGVINAGTTRRLMKGRTGAYENSWVVAKRTNRKAGSRRGWPTGYVESDIHPDCLHQIRTCPNDILDDEDALRKWLKEVEDERES
jgi:hypothetical protein